MQVVLNGQPHQLPEPATIDRLLEDLFGQPRRVAVEINGEIVPRSRHTGYRLQDGDRIEVVHAIGGG